MRLAVKRKTSLKQKARLKKKVRVRQHLEGTSERPRLSVFKSLTAIYAQIVDDVSGKTLVSANTSELSDKASKNVESAKKLGETLAKRALEKKIDAVVFDRNGYLFHGKIKAVAEGARAAGLKF